MTSLLLFAADLAVMGVYAHHKGVLAVGVIVAGLFLGINNTLITEAVMGAAPVERGTASAAYSFVRFSGGAVAPWLAGKLGEEINVQIPFYVGAFAVLLAVGVLATGWKPLSHLRIPANHSAVEAEALTAADA
jgi:MFS family permease